MVSGSVASAATLLSAAGSLRGQPRVQLSDDLEIGDERAQLGGGAEVELRALIDVERLIEIVRLHPQIVPAVAAFVEREAVDQGIAGRAGIEQAVAEQAHLARGRADRSAAAAPR